MDRLVSFVKTPPKSVLTESQTFGMPVSGTYLELEIPWVIDHPAQKKTFFLWKRLHDKKCTAAP
jgi:hypothetical protein